MRSCIFLIDNSRVFFENSIFTHFLTESLYSFSIILFENLFKPRQRRLTVGMVTDFVSSIHNLKTVFRADFVSSIHNLKAVL